MKFSFTDLGPIHKGEIELSDLTILCGENNTGKTYITNAIYSLLDNWRELITWNLQENISDNLFNTGIASINLKDTVANNFPEFKKQLSEGLSANLSNYFACSSKIFEKTKIKIDFDLNEDWIKSSTEVEMKSLSGNISLSVIKKNGSPDVEIIINDSPDLPVFILRDKISEILTQIVLKKSLPNAFIASAERTGAAIFKNELNFNKNQLVRYISEMDNHKTEFNPFDFISKFKRTYAISVERNVEFISSLSQIVESSEPSELIRKNPELIKKFEDIAGGTYKSNKEGALHFIPSSLKESRLGIGESSSAVRSLLIIWYWLNYKAKKGDMLMIDEPELNLHPKNQRKLAQFVSTLISCGVKVFMTTHSDYIIRELNTLILLDSDKPHINKVKEKFGYEKEATLSKEQVAVYTTTEKLFEIPNQPRRKRLGTIERWFIDENGISIKSFDDQIKDINNIQDSILFGI